MSNVIDALKRLERVGSETSKTTEKLIEAARALSEHVCSIVGLVTGKKMLVLSALKTEDQQFHSYAVDFRKGYASGVLDIWLYDKWIPVFDGRDTALAFSKDVASGLIDAIADRVERIGRENTEVLGGVGTAQTQGSDSLSGPSYVIIPAQVAKGEAVSSEMHETLKRAGENLARYGQFGPSARGKR